MHEEKTITRMIEIYCNNTHGTHKREICTECSTLLEYSLGRLYNCPLQPNKPVCSSCLVQCYREDMRAKIRTVMRYAGKKMLFFHPLLTVSYVMKKCSLID